MRDAYQIAFLVGEILPAFQKKVFDEQLKRAIVRLSDIANEIGIRLKSSNFEHISDLCRNLIDITMSIRENLRDPSPKDLDLLKPLSDAILIAVNPDKNAKAMAGEINRMLARFGTRR